MEEKRTILVIGGRSGIGKALVEMLVADGHEVIAASRNIEQADLPSGVKKMTYDAVNDEKLPEVPEKLDGLAYCPGSINLQPFKRFSLDTLRAEMELNYLGAVKVLHQVIGKLKASKRGSAVFFSTVAVQMGLPFHSSVSAGKGAVEGLVRSLAAEYAPSVRFNAVAPALVDTPMAEGMLNNDKKRESNAQRNPLKKIGTPEDIAGMAAFLLSDKGNWMTGQVVGVDGGMGSVRPL
jgi:NAD(P)-dependent dehydrogenase (short-subunit alcohol dehydrogenase family)